MCKSNIEYAEELTDKVKRGVMTVDEATTEFNKWYTWPGKPTDTTLEKMLAEAGLLVSADITDTDDWSPAVA